jgi:hypothetical protein
MIVSGINFGDEQTMTDRVREQIATMLADAELLRAGGNAKAAERMTKDAARLRKRLERHMATREARADKWEAQTLGGFVAALELMTGDVPEATGLKLPDGDAKAGTSCVRSALGSGDATLRLIRSQCSDGSASTKEAAP